MPEKVEMDKFTMTFEQKQKTMNEMVVLKMLSNYGQYYVLSKDFKKSIITKLIKLMEIKHHPFDEAFDEAKILAISEVIGVINLEIVMKYLTIVDSYVTPEEFNRLKTEVEKLVKK